MAITTATLGGSSLPTIAPDGYRQTVEYRGSDRVMLSGALSTDLISTSSKQRFELRWTMLTETQVAVVVAAWALVRDGSAAFVSPLGVSHTVTRDVGVLELEITWQAVRLDPRASVTMRLREV